MRTSRSRFLKLLEGLRSFSIVPRHVLGNGYIAPSDQLTKGIIGTGGMGRGHVNYAGTRLVAVCDVDKNHLELGKKLVKEKIAAYHDFRDLILDPNVDIVHIATPPHWHGIMSVEAAKAGKDIWCEKPMTRTIGEGKRVMEGRTAIRTYVPPEYMVPFYRPVLWTGHSCQTVEEAGAKRIVGMAVEGDDQCAYRFQLEVFLGRKRISRTATGSGRVGLRHVARPGSLQAL